MQSEKRSPSWTVRADVISIVTQVLRAEAMAISHVIDHLPSVTTALISHIVATRGKVIFSGIGKSGLVGQKLAATWSSLGIPSLFIHPTDAVHGDLGVVQKDDLFIALSKSGSGSEFEFLFSILRSQGIMTYLLCCNQGVLADKADFVLCLPFDKEACPLNLAPTSSSTIMMAFGDAVAVAVSMCKGFDSNAFARHHPAGALGKKLLLTVRSLMHHNDQLPLVNPATPFNDVLVAITSKKLGVCAIVDEHNALKGIVTDGDLRRACNKGPEVFNTTAIEIATRYPKTVAPDVLAYTALETMETYNITSLVVVDKGAVVGLVHIHDLIKIGLRG